MSLNFAKIDENLEKNARKVPNNRYEKSNLISKGPAGAKIGFETI